MNNAQPLTKEKLLRVIIQNQYNMRILLDEVRNAQISAVCWRNNLREYETSGSLCVICRDVKSGVMFWDPEEHEFYELVLMCSVCATNHAFGIDNKKTNGVGE